MPHRMIRRSALSLACAGLLPSLALAQINRPTPAVGDRLLAPKPVVARQVAAGRIELTWGSVPEAASYQITRSVPPNPVQVVSDPDPSDTVFIDNDVTAGKTYYYLVAAVSEQGGVGLKASSEPVLAVAQPDTTARPDTAAQTALEAPKSFTATAFSSPYVTFYWAYPTAMSYVIERAIVGGEKSVLEWKVRLRTPTLPCCHMTARDLNDDLDQLDRAVYRVTAVDPAQPGRKSPPTQSEIINPGVRLGYSAAPGEFWLAPVRGRETTIKVGEHRGTGAAEGVDRVAVLDSSVVTLNPYGSYIGKRPGVTYVIRMRQAPNGSPFIQAERVTVLP